MVHLHNGILLGCKKKKKKKRIASVYPPVIWWRQIPFLNKNMLINPFWNFIVFFFFTFFLSFFLFREREREGEREGEKHQCVGASPRSPTWDLAHNPRMCPDWELNWWPFGLQANTESTEPHQSGQLYWFSSLGFFLTLRNFPTWNVSLFTLLHFIIP